MGRADLVANVKLLRKHPVVGAGVISDLKSAASRVVDKVKDTAASVVEKVKSALFFTPNKIPGNAQTKINKYKDMTIKTIYIFRQPIQGVLKKIANWISGGEYQKKIESLGYTDAFHLFSVVEFTNGKYIVLEKNQRINMKSTSGPPSSDCITIKISNDTLGQLFEKGLKSMGDHDFFQYSADNNNCQKFLNELLKANGYGSAATTKFIMQDAKGIFDSFTKGQKAAIQGATDLGGKIEQVVTGQGVLGSLKPKAKRRVKVSAGC
jgi:hypothetical protein